MELSRFMTHSLKSSPWGNKIARILAAALKSVDPRAAVLANLILKNTNLEVNRKTYDLTSFERIFLVGAGKAGQPMAEAIQEILGYHIDSGKVIVKEGYKTDVGITERIEIIEAGHPIPDHRGVNGAQKIIHLLEGTTHNDLVICLFSGGGSALMVSPVPGVSLKDLQDLTHELLASGATVNEINTLRKHLDLAKGGQIARYASPGKVISLILSDVVGDPLDVIASGPTVPDPSTYNDSLVILDHYQIKDRIPESIVEHLVRGKEGTVTETPKPGEEIFDQVNNVVVGSNRTAAQAALVQAEMEGFNTFILSNYLQGEASQAGKFLGSILHQVAAHNQPLPRPACIIIGGETTVTLRGNGHGGRNQEIALGAVDEIAGLRDVALVSLATDGGDGLTNAAGAMVTGDTLHRAQSLKLDPKSFLAENDTYNFFNPLGDLLKTGPTMTNVNDLAFLFAF